MTDASDGGRNEGTIPVRVPSTFCPAERDASVAGIVLAAGTSSRYGDANKLLVQVDGRPVVQQATRTLTAAGVDPVVVIVGHEADRVRAAVDSLPVTVVENPDYTDGQSTSVRAGIDVIQSMPDPDAVVIGLGDMPAVEPATVETLIHGYEAGAASILAAGYQGQRGNPVLFDRQYFDALAGVSGDRGARELIRRSDRSVVVDVDDPGVVRDVDVPGDLVELEEE